MLYSALWSVSIFLKSKNSVIMNVKAFNLGNKSISLYLIADSLSLRCSSGTKECKISTL